MMLEKNGTISFQHDGRTVSIRYAYWALVEANIAYPHVNIYDKDGTEYRFYRNPKLSKWRPLYKRNKWPIEFRKKLAIELEKINAEVTEQINTYKKPTYEY